MNLKHPLRLIFSLIPALAMMGCGDSDNAAPEIINPDVPEAYLSLSVANLELPDRLSRADKYEFENPAADNELIQTMRFIIVDGDGNVEHNISIAQAANSYTQPRLFKVKPNDTKTVYLFGNESSIPDDIISRFKALQKGEPFPSDYNDVILSRQEGNALFAAGQLIPMTEFHKVSIGEPRYNGNTPVPYDTIMFVTRTTVKVTFSLEVSENYPDFSPGLLSTVNINEIADIEYLFPRDTYYSPAKSLSADPRIITAYAVPAAAKTAPHTLTWTKSGDDDQRSFTTGSVYLPETRYGSGADPKSYSITLPVNGVNLTANLPNLPSLPRNTHVRVNINLNGRGMNCTVDVLPYTGVNLNPDFGINRP